MSNPETTTQSSIKSLTVLDPNATHHWAEVHATGCADLRKRDHHGLPKGQGAYTIKVASLTEATNEIGSDFIGDGENTFDSIHAAIHYADCVRLPLSLNNESEQAMTDTTNTDLTIDPQPEAPAAEAPKTDEVLSEPVTATPVATQWYLNGKPVGESMNRLNRVATFYTHHISDKPEYAKYGHGKPWLNTAGFLSLIKDLGVTDPAKDFEVTLPNGNTLAVRYGQGGAPVTQPAPKATKAAKKATAVKASKATSERLTAMNAELAAVAEWKANGEQGDKPAMPVTDARNAELKAEREAKSARLQATKAAVTTARAKDAQVTPITKASQVGTSKRSQKRAEAAKRAELVTAAATKDAEVAAAEDKIAELEGSNS